MRQRRVVAMIGKGVEWGDGPPEAQSGWDEHAAWIDALVDRGTIVMGGPYSDNSGAMLILEGLSTEEAELLLTTDPFMQNGVFVVDDVREWTNYVDRLTAN